MTLLDFDRKKHRKQRRKQNAQRDHEASLALLDRAHKALHESGDKVNCLAVVAVGPAMTEYDSGVVHVFGRWCCRWHAYALLGTLDELRGRIVQTLLEPDDAVEE